MGTYVNPLASTKQKLPTVPFFLFSSCKQILWLQVEQALDLKEKAIS